MVTTNERRTLVNLSVVASSVAMFAAAWAGIAHADGNQYRGNEVETTAAVLTPARAAIISELDPAPASSEGQAPSQTPHRVVVVRESRAS